MSRVYEIPTHLQVEDALIAGLTPRQLLRLIAGASGAYALWDQLGFLPTGLRASVTVGAAVLGVVFALIQPGDRPLDQWVFAAALFLVSPSQWRWRRTDSLETEDIESDDEWSQLSAPIGWVDAQSASLNLSRGPSATEGLLK
jgi:hypothetical protein